MSGKKTIFIIIIFTIVALILTWFWLQNIIDKYDIDRAIDTSNQLMTEVKGIKNWLNFI